MIRIWMVLFDVEAGLRKARELLIYLTDLGLPLAT